MAGTGAQARLREALNAGGPTKEKGDKSPPTTDGILTITADTPEALEWRGRTSAIDCVQTNSSFLEQNDGAYH